MAFGITAANAATIVVPGTSNPFLAGAPSGATIQNLGSGDIDTAAADAPVGIAVTPGETFTITNVTGMVSNGPCCAADGPTGGSPIGSDEGATTGFTDVVSPFASLPINSLIGVFFDPTPGGAGVDTVFEIGNGGTFTVPTGTTELYLATVDGYQWNNNSGAFTVTYGVPEPATWAMFLVGFGALGFMMRAGRRKQSGAVATA